eukprot:COSAG06_NODE_1524_length_9197_cov_21.393430_3_plen_156_part_00
MCRARSSVWFASTTMVSPRQLVASSVEHFVDSTNFRPNVPLNTRGKLPGVTQWLISALLPLGLGTFLRPFSYASTCGCSTQLSAARRAWRAASSSPQPCPSARRAAAGAPDERAAQAPVDGPGSCCVCAAARGGPTEQHDMVFAIVLDTKLHKVG